VKGFLSKWPRLTVALSVFFTLQIALALWFLPEAARRIGVGRLASLVDAPVQIEDVDLNLFTRRARITNLSIGSPEGGRPLLHLPRIDVNFSLIPLFRGLVVLRSISFFQPRAFVERLDGNRFNLAEVIRPQGDEPGGVDLAVEQMEIQAGQVSFVDRALASASERVLKDIRLKTGKISTSSELSVTPTSFNLRLDIGAGTLAMAGSTAFFGRTTGIELLARWKNLNPAIFAPYLPSPYEVDFSGSFLNGEARYLLKREGEKTVGHLLTASAESGPFRLLQPEPLRPALVLAGLKAQNASLDFLTNRFRLGELALAQLSLLIERDVDGRLNLTPFFASNGSAVDLSEAEVKEPEDSPPLQIEIQQARVEGGTIEIKDPTVDPVMITYLEKLRLTIQNLAFAENAPAATLEADAHLSEGLVRISGTLSPQPLAAQLLVEAQRVPFAPFRGYVDSALTSGRSRAGDMNGRLELSLSADKQDRLNVDIAGKVEAHTVALELAGGSRPPVQAEKLVLEINRIRTTPKLDVDIGRLQFDKADLRLERDRKGDLSLQAFWTAPGQADLPKGPSSKSSPEATALKIRRLEVNQGRVAWLDRSLWPEVVTDVRDIELTLREGPLGANAKLGLLEAEGRVEKAPVRIKGTIGFEPLFANLSINSKGLPLKPYRSYIDPALSNFEIRDGQVSGNVNISFERARGDALAFKASGKLEADDFALGLAGLSEPPFRVKKLTVDLARLNTAPAFDLELSRIQLAGAELKVERDKGGNVNVKRLAEPSAEAQVKEKAAKPKPEQKKTRAIMGSLEVSEGKVSFADRSISPEFQTTLSELSIKLGKVGVPGSRTSIALEAALDESAKLELKGWFTPFQDSVRVQLEGKIVDYDLSRLNPYASKYIQYEIKRGRVTIDVEYEYNEGDLEGENEIAIRHLQLGNQLGKEFENQVGISLKLALALIEDLDGRIRLRVPIRGDISSPDFTIAGVVWKAVRNAVINFLATPFRLLGNILTVGGKIGQIRIAPAEFMPGSSELTAKAKEQLNQLVGFLKEKPRLEIELRGYVSKGEIAALKRERLRQEIKPKPGESYRQAISQLYRTAGAKVVPNQLPSLEIMENHLAERYVITDSELHKLVNEREQLVAKRLAEVGLERQRIFVKGDDAENFVDAPSGRVEFELLY
jgi:uncharacterized protein involved in outer membrane biogenesis